MAQTQELWRCIHCNGLYTSQKKAIECAKSHVRKEIWATGKGKNAYRVFENCAPGSFGSLEWALKKADETEDI